MIEDTVLSEERRWGVVKPPGTHGASILMARAVGAKQLRAVGDQSGGRVFQFLILIFDRDHQNLLENDVNINRGPSKEPYGKVVVFMDLYGNLWDLIGPA